MTPEEHECMRVAILMAQELQEFVDDAREGVGEGYLEEPLQATEELLKDWEKAFAAAGIVPRWQDVLASQCGDEDSLDI